MQIIDQYIDRFRPAARTVADRAEAYAARIIARLDAIHDDLQGEEWQETRRFITVNLAAAATNQPVAEVPVGSMYAVEAVTMIPTGAGTMSVVLRDGNGGTPRWAANVTGPDSKSGNGVILESGVSLTADSAGLAGLIVVQVRVRTPNPALHSNMAGGIQNGTDGLDPRHSEDLRHMAPWVGQGEPVIGDRSNGIH